MVLVLDWIPAPNVPPERRIASNMHSTHQMSLRDKQIFNLCTTNKPRLTIGCVPAERMMGRTNNEKVKAFHRNAWCLCWIGFLHQTFLRNVASLRICILPIKCPYG